MSTGLVLVPTKGHEALLAPACGVSPPLLMRVAGLWRTPDKAARLSALSRTSIEAHGLALAFDGALVFPGIDRAARYWAAYIGADLTLISYATKADGIARRCVEQGLARAYAIDADGRAIEVEAPDHAGISHR